MIALGELGLSGECRAVSNLELRIKEAERLGFTKILVPHRNIEHIKTSFGAEIIPVRTIYDALRIIKRK